MSNSLYHQGRITQLGLCLLSFVVHIRIIELDPLPFHRARVLKTDQHHNIITTDVKRETHGILTLHNRVT